MQEPSALDGAIEQLAIQSDGHAAGQTTERLCGGRVCLCSGPSHSLTALQMLINDAVNGTSDLHPAQPLRANLACKILFDERTQACTHGTSHTCICARACIHTHTCTCRNACTYMHAHIYRCARAHACAYMPPRTHGTHSTRQCTQAGVQQRDGQPNTSIQKRIGRKMDARADGRMDGWTDAPTDGYKDRQTEGCTNRGTDGRTDGLADRQTTDRTDGCTDKRMHRRRRTDGSGRVGSSACLGVCVYSLLARSLAHTMCILPAPIRRCRLRSLSQRLVHVRSNLHAHPCSRACMHVRARRDAARHN